MKMPIVVYIDDDQDQALRDLQRASHNILDIKFILPKKNIDDLVEQIFSYHPDAVIVDFRLADMVVGIGYNGYSVAQIIVDSKEDFPVFILTSNADEAFVLVDDVNFVYEKGQVLNGKNFALRVTKQIEKYKQNILDSENKIMQLLEKRKHESLSHEEEKELIKLDSFIEKTLDKQSAVPDELKVTSNEKRVSDILKEVDELIEEVKKKLPKQ